MAKLEVFEQEIQQRQTVAEKYTTLLTNAGLSLPQVAPENTSVWAQYTVLSDDRDALGERLRAKGVPSVSYYAVPLHLQPVFAGLGHRRGDFPLTEQVASKGLSLPMSPQLGESGIEKVAGGFKKQSN